MNLNIKRLTDSAHLPTKATSGSAGIDLYADIPEEDGAGHLIAPGDTYMVHTGIAMEIPDGYVGLIFARSGLSIKEGLAPANKVGVIDSDYRGEIIVALYNHSNQPKTVETGQRIAQMVITPFVSPDIAEVSELSDTARGEGGFGSTGKA